jgi:hypothetical protein
MATIILPMAYRRYRHSINRSSQSERKLPGMTGNRQETDFQLKAKSGEIATHRISPLARDLFSSDILTCSVDLSNFASACPPPPLFLS